MNQNIKKLSEIAAKKERTIIGLMSGTSLDGLDVAVCKIKNHGFETEITVPYFETIAYDTSFRNELKGICFKENILLQKLTLLHKTVAIRHAEIINSLLQKWKLNKEEIDLVASHGQTIYHAPFLLHKKQEYGDATLQIGDGDQIAVKTGIITISDFRQKNIAAGGQGAPLAVYGDLLLFAEKEKDVILLNIGGIANFTYLPAGPGEIISSDTGPGNTLMDQCMGHNFPGKSYDKDAAIALTGKVNEALLNALKNHPFFKDAFPKTTGPELFNLAFLSNALIHAGIKDLSTEDIMATLNKFTADTICYALKAYTTNKKSMLYISGGGLHNPLLMQHLKRELKDFSIHTTAEKGIDPDAKEAILFAILANECVTGDINTFKSTSAKIPAVNMGKISFPY